MFWRQRWQQEIDENDAANLVFKRAHSKTKWMSNIIRLPGLFCHYIYTTAKTDLLSTRIISSVNSNPLKILRTDESDSLTKSIRLDV